MKQTPNKFMKLNEDSYQKIIETVNEGVWIVDYEERTILINSKMSEMLGYSNKEIYGKKCYDFLKKNILSNLSGLIKNRQKIQINEDIIIESKDGRLITANISITPLYEETQKFAGTLLMVTDVSDRILSEKALKESNVLMENIFASLQDALLIISLSTQRVIECNPAAAIMFGYEKDKIIGRKINFLHVNDSSFSDYGKFIKPLKKERSYIFIPELSMKRNGGAIFISEQNILPLMDDNNKVIGWINVVRDISERKKIESELITSRQQLRAFAANLQDVREKERTAIAREIHDEFGQVLTALKMNLSLIENEINDKTFSNTDLITELSNMQHIIDGTINKVRKLITELRPEVLDNLGIMDALEWQLNEFKNRSNISYTFDTNIKILNVNQEFSVALFRIFQEALTNILRHSKANKIKVSLNRTNNLLTLKIIDNGIGLDTSYIDSSESFGILGMKERALIFGGSVTIKSEIQKGTTVVVNLPLMQS